MHCIEMHFLLNFRIIATDLNTTLATYQKIQLIVNECIHGQPLWNNPTILSPTVTVLFCLCQDTYAGMLSTIDRRT